MPLPDPAVAQSGNYYALVVGINRYRAPLPSLRTAVNDAQAIAKILSDRYAFQVKVLVDEDATRNNILDALSRYRRTLGESDNLLIYFAGHGYSDPEADKTYWLPADADRDTNSNWIIADDITTSIKVQQARHVLIISDSCYSGGLARDAEIVVREQDEQRFLRKMMAGKSRTLMASGGNEPVADGGANGHSVFANAVLAALTAVPDSMFTASDLFHEYVQRQVGGKSNQVPQYDNIRNSNDEAGDFVFSKSATPGAGRVEMVHGASNAESAAPSPQPSFAPTSRPAARPTTAPPSMPPDSNSAAFGLSSDRSSDTQPFDPVATRQKANAAYARGAYYIALPLYKQLADTGDSTAMAAIGTLYDLGGDGVPKDVRIAAQWQLKAAAAGNTAAMQSIGLQYLTGDGVPQDDVQAAHWLLLAAQAGQVMAEGAMGMMYEKGRGVPKNLDQAVSWYRKAAAEGEPKAKESLKRLGRQ